MKKILSTFLFLFLLTKAAHGQGNLIEVEFQVGYGTFAMKEAKKFVNRGVIETPFPLKVVEDFPSFVVYCGSLSLPMKNNSIRLGFSLGSTSTGSRAHYQDYSGEVKIDHLTSAFSMAVTGEKVFNLLPSEKISLSLTSELGAIFTDYKVESYIQVHTQEEQNKVNLSSESIYFDPGIKFRYRVLSFLQIGTELSYLYDTQGKLHLPSSRKSYLMDYSNKPVRSDWSGLRTEVGVGILF